MVFIDGYMEYLLSKGHSTVQGMVVNTSSHQACFYRAHASVGVAEGSMKHIFMVDMLLLGAHPSNGKYHRGVVLGYRLLYEKSGIQNFF